MEFMPVVLAAGVGKGLDLLTSRYPKALLPIGNLPAVYYPLAMLERHGFGEAIVVIPRSYEKEIRTTLLEDCNIKMKLIFESIVDTQLEDHGTMHSLRLVRSKIPENTDVLVVGCDLITDLNLNHLFNLFHKTDASFTMLLSSLKESRDLPVPAHDKAKLEKERRASADIFVYNEDNGRLIIMDKKSNLNGEVELDSGLMKMFPQLTITAATDCHLYLLKRWIIDYLTIHQDCEMMKSLKQDLLPFLVKKQFPSEDRLEVSRFWTKSPVEGEAPARLLKLGKEHDVYAFAEIPAALDVSKNTLDLAETMSAGITDVDFTAVDKNSGALHVTRDDDVIRCYTYVQNSGFCIRSNTFSRYCDANALIAKAFPTLVPHNPPMVHPSVKAPRSAQVSDCFIGESSTVGEKVLMTKTVVGAKSVVHNKAKISNSIIMDQVEIGEDCMVMNTVVCSGTVVGGKCEIKDSVLRPSSNVQSASKHSFQLI